MRMKSKLIAALVAAGSIIGASSAAYAVPYHNGLTLTVGPVKYTFTSCTIPTHTGVVTPGACSTLSVTPDTAGGTDGFTLSGLISAIGSASKIEIDLNYTATMLVKGKAIDKVTMTQTGSVSALAHMSDTITTMGGAFEADLLTSGLAPITSKSLAKFVKTLKFAQVIDVTGGSKACGKKTCPVAEQMSIIHVLPHVGNHRNLPEPASLALVGAAIAGAARFGRRRRASQAA